MELHLDGADDEPSCADGVAILGPRQFSFQTDPADYTELGQQYRQKSIRAEIALLAYGPTLFIAILLASLA